MADKPRKQVPSAARKKEEAELDEALDESFPASDPASPVQPHKQGDEDGPDKKPG